MSNNKKYKDILVMDAQKYGYKIKDEKRLEILAEKFKYQKEQYGEMYCPCQLDHTVDTICPCRYMRNYGACHCGLYEQAGEKDA